MRTRTLLLSALFLATLPGLGHAQIEDNLSAYTGPNARGYLEPLRDSLGSGLGAGLFTSAHVPTSRLLLRIEARAMVVTFGDDDRTFDAVTEEYFPGTATSSRAPTVVGPTEGTQVVDPNSGATFRFPGGLDLERIPLAAPQLVVGGVAGTELLLRWFAADLGDADLGELSLFGIGVRHSVSQYVRDLPVEVAVMVVHQSFEIGDELVDFSMTSFGAQASRRFTLLEPYAGLALDRSSMSVEYESDLTGTGSSRLSVDFEDQTSMRLTLGSALHLSVLHLNGEVAISERTTFSLGLSVGI